jgi:DNA mismatch repair ATPase MutS
MTEGIAEGVTVTSYLEVTKMGDLGFQKTYYIKTPNEKWPTAAFAVNLYTTEDAERYENPEEELLTKELSDAQKQRVEMADEIVKSLKFN